MVEQQPSKLNTRVRFPSPAPVDLKTCSAGLPEVSRASPAATRATVMAGLVHTGSGFAALWRPARTLLTVASIVISTAAGQGRAADAPAPSPDRLERITEFFDNEIATGKLAGAVVLIQQHGKP